MTDRAKIDQWILAYAKIHMDKIIDEVLTMDSPDAIVIPRTMRSGYLASQIKENTRTTLREYWAQVDA